MHLDPTEEQRLIQRTAADFAIRHLAPGAAARDVDSTFPTDELRQLAELGLMGVAIPASLGGSEAGPVAYVLAMQELARGDASVAVAVSVTNMVGELIVGAGSDAQAREHVTRLCSGEYLCASFALSEPQAGSDPSAITTEATRSEGGWSITGTKQWVTNGGHSDLLVVWAVTDPDAGHDGITAFLVRGDAEGLSVTRREEKMGLHGSSTAQVYFDGVKVGDDAVLGEVGDGFKLAMIALDGGRISIAAQALGVARMALDAAITYARERETFGAPIITHQAVGNMLADASTWADAAELMIARAAYLKQSGKPYTRAASMAKLFATEKASEICDIAIQVHGGYGYTRDFPVERAYRDSRVARIYEGTSEIQRLVIARDLIKEASP